MIQTFTRFHKLLMLLSLILLLASAALGYVANRSAQEAQTVHSSAEQRVQQLNQAKDKLSKPMKAPDAAALNRAIPLNWDMDRFLADLTLAAEATGITLDSVAPASYDEPLTDNKNQGKALSSDTSTGISSSSSGASSSMGGTAMGSASGGGTAENVTTTNMAANTSSASGSSTAGSAASSGNAQKVADETAPPVSLKGIYALTLTVAAEGKEAQLVNFLDRLQQMPRFVWINSYELNVNAGQAGGTGGQPVADKITVKLTLYSHAPWSEKESASLGWPFHR